MRKSIKIWELIIKCHFSVSTSVESAPVRMPGIKNILCWKTLKKLVCWRRHTHWFFETEVCTHKSERNRDAKPQCQDGHQCTKGNSGGGALYPQDQDSSRRNPQTQSCKNIAYWNCIQAYIILFLLLGNVLLFAIKTVFNLPRTQKGSEKNIGFPVFTTESWWNRGNRGSN